TIRAGTALTATPSTTPARWTGDGIARDELLIARVDDGAAPAGAVAEDRFDNVLARNADAFATVHVGDGTFVDRVGHRPFDRLPVAGQESLPVAGTFVLAVQGPASVVARTHSLASLLLRLPDPQIPCAKQPHLLRGIAPGNHAVHELRMFLLIFVGGRGI